MGLSRNRLLETAKGIAASISRRLIGGFTMGGRVLKAGSFKVATLEKRHLSTGG